jgi:hypothetical protein
MDERTALNIATNGLLEAGATREDEAMFRSHGAVVARTLEQTIPDEPVYDAVDGFAGWIVLGRAGGSTAAVLAEKENTLYLIHIAFDEGQQQTTVAVERVDLAETRACLSQGDSLREGGRQRMDQPSLAIRVRWSAGPHRAQGG